MSIISDTWQKIITINEPPNFLDLPVAIAVIFSHNNEIRDLKYCSHMHCSDQIWLSYTITMDFAKRMNSNGTPIYGVKKDVTDKNSDLTVTTIVGDWLKLYLHPINNI
jgi:hypothetical protein